MTPQSSNKIYINARFLSQQKSRLTGVQRYAIQVICALDSLIETGEIDKNKFSITLISPKSIQYTLPLKHISLEKVGFMNGHLWEQIELPFYSRNGFLLNLTNTAPIARSIQIATIHDVSVFAIPHAYSFTFRTWYKLIFIGLKNRTKAFITVSHFSKNEIIKYLGVNSNKIHAIYEGKEHIYAIDSDISLLQKNHLLDKRFILLVSSMSPHKNFITTLQAIEQLADTEIYFVIVGINYPKVFMPPKLQSSEKVMHLGFVSDSELKALYEHAFCFLHPTLYEGFGLPPLEAMACGCPVVLSNTTALPEIFGDAALYFDPSDPEDIASKVKQLINSHQLQKELIQKSKQHAELFSWKKCAQDIYKVLEQEIAH